MDKRTLESKLGEVLLEEAVQQFSAAECARLMEEAEGLPDPPYSAGYRRKMARLLGRRRSRTRLIHVCRKAAAVVLVLGMGASSMMLTAQAFRGNLWQFIEGIRTDYTAYIQETEPVEYEGEMVPQEWGYLYIPGYLPKGYALEKDEDLRSYFLLRFQQGEDEKSFILFKQYKKTRKGRFIDTEDARVKKVRVGSGEGDLSRKEGQNVLQWDNGDRSFSLNSTISVEQLVKIAENLQKLEKGGE